jgi:hypothetical protein
LKTRTKSVHNVMAIDNNTRREYTGNMNEFEQAMSAVLTEGLARIEALTDEQLEAIYNVFDK